MLYSTQDKSGYMCSAEMSYDICKNKQTKKMKSKSVACSIHEMVNHAETDDCNRCKIVDFQWMLIEQQSHKHYILISKYLKTWTHTWRECQSVFKFTVFGKGQTLCIIYLNMSIT